jgi:hypothetical protein
MFTAGSNVKLDPLQALAVVVDNTGAALISTVVEQIDELLPLSVADQTIMLVPTANAPLASFPDPERVVAPIIA